MGRQQIDAEIDAIVAEFRNLVKDFAPKQMREIMRPAAKMVAREIAAAAPVAPRTVYRYSTPKLSKGLRAPKGSGVKVAAYKPGNLGRSIGVLTFRRSASLYIGPRSGKKTRNGDDGYYAHLVEFGVPSRGIPANPFIRNTWARTKSQALSMITKSAEKVVKKYANKK